jgi:hypothetical protein
VSEKTTLSKTGAWPFYAVPYNGGIVIGWMQFGNAATNGFGGTCVWTKPAGQAVQYSGGFTNAVAVSGCLFKAPPLSYRAFGPSKLSFHGGSITSSFTNAVTWGTDNKVLNQSGNSLTFSLSTANGLFKGTVTDPVSGQKLPFQGVLLESQNRGVGFFPGTSKSGGVTFTPNP